MTQTDYFPSSLAPSCIDFTNDQPPNLSQPPNDQPASPSLIVSEGFYSIQWSINDEDRIGTRDFEITSDPTDDYTQIITAFPLEDLDGQTSEEDHPPSRMVYPSTIYRHRKMTVTAPKFTGRQFSRRHCSDRIEKPRSPADVCGVPYRNRYESEASSSRTELASVVIESRSSSEKQDAPPLTVSGCQSPLTNMSDSTSSPILSLPKKSIDPGCSSLRKSTCKSVPLEILGCHPIKVGGQPTFYEQHTGPPISDGQSIRRQLNELTTQDDTTDDFDPQDTLNWLEICLNYSENNAAVLDNTGAVKIDDLAWDPKGLRVTGCNRSWAKVETRESARILGHKPDFKTQPMKVARMVEISINNEFTTEWDTLINRILRESEEERESMRIELENEKETLRRQTDEQTAKIHRDLNRLESELNRVELEKAELGSSYTLDCRRMKAETERLERCLKDITASYNRLETSYCDKETRHKQDVFRMQSCLESKNNELRNLVQQTQSQDKSGQVAALEAELEILRAAIASQNLSLANLTSQNQQLTTLNTELQTQTISKDQKKALEFEEAKENFETIKKTLESDLQQKQ